MIRAFAFALLMLLGVLPAAAQVVPYGQLNQSQKIAVIARAVEAGDTGLAQKLLSGSRFTEGDLGYQAAFLQARVFRAEGAFAEAEALLRQILKERPEFRAVRAELAGLLAERGRGRAARVELRSLAAGASNPDERRAFEALLDRVGSNKPPKIIEMGNPKNHIELINPNCCAFKLKVSPNSGNIPARILKEKAVVISAKQLP